MSEIVKQFLKVQNFNNWTDDKKNEVNENGQIVFVPGATRSDVVDVNAIYANGDVFGDGALSNKTVLTQGFKVEGGPLSDLLKDKGITEIEEGTNLQDLLKSLFCVELWPQRITVTRPAVTVTNVAPKITGVKGSGLYEVGTTLDITVALQTMAVSNTAARISGFEYGLSYNNTKYESARERVQNNTIVYDNGFYAGKYSYSINASGSMNDDKTFTSTSNANLNVENGSQSFTVFTYLGSNNTVTAVSAYCKGLNYSNIGITSTYELSNLGSTGHDAGRYSYSIDPVSDVNVSRDETPKTTTVSWSGAYPIYFEGTKYTYTGNANDIPSSDPVIGTFTKCDVLKRDGEMLDIYVKFPNQAASGGWKIVIPKVYANDTTITAKAYNSLSSKYEAVKTFVKTETQRECTCGTNGNTKYQGFIYSCTGTDGANGLKLTIKL